MEEARKANDLKGFAKAHPSKGDRNLFNKLFNVMAKKTVKDAQTSKQD